MVHLLNRPAACFCLASALFFLSPIQGNAQNVQAGGSSVNLDGDGMTVSTGGGTAVSLSDNPTTLGECHISIVSAQENGKTSVKSEKFSTKTKLDCEAQSEKFQGSGVDVFYRWRPSN